MPPLRVNRAIWPCSRSTTRRGTMLEISFSRACRSSRTEAVSVPEASALRTISLMTSSRDTAALSVETCLAIVVSAVCRASCTSKDRSLIALVRSVAVTATSSSRCADAGFEDADNSAFSKAVIRSVREPDVPDSPTSVSSRFAKAYMSLPPASWESATIRSATRTGSDCRTTPATRTPPRVPDPSALSSIVRRP